MGVYRGRHISDKWAKTLALLSHPDVAPHIPQTKPFRAELLYEMLDRYGMVVVKPLSGFGGEGILKVSKIPAGFSCAYRNRSSSFRTFGELLRYIHLKRRGRKYLIQRGIFLAESEGRPVDYRVKYVKSAKGWRFRAIVGKVAKPGLFVTNIRQGGKLVRATRGIGASIGSEQAVSKISKMRQLAIWSTEALERKYPGIQRLGYDFGIDKRGDIWIFEVNTRPQ